MSSPASQHGSDLPAAFTGLVLGAIVLFVILFGIVKLTAAHFDREHPAATATQ